jgi:hypothetical protein
MMLISCVAFSQEKRNYQWIFGNTGDGYGVVLDFNSIPVNIKQHNIGLRPGNSNTSMCDVDGELLFYGNGCYICNSEHRLMDNSDSLTSGFMYEEFCRNGQGGDSPVAQGALAIPHPGKQSIFLLFNQNLEVFLKSDQTYLIAPSHLFYQVIDMSANDGLGRVIFKNQIAIQDTLGSGITAVPHANGTHWWVMVPKSETNCYYLFQISEEGVHAPQLKCAGQTWNSNAAGTSTFSPDAKKFLRFNYFNGLHVYDFDNATGELSNAKQMFFPNDTFPSNSGITVAPGSRYAYISTRKRLYQLDLESDNIEAGTVMIAELDVTNIPNAPSFHKSSLAPDGKVYIIGGGSSKMLHIVHRPDCPGTLCQVEQRGLQLPVLSHSSIHASPHFRNEPSEISCDSINSSDPVPGTIPDIKVYPVPSLGSVTIDADLGFPLNFGLWDITGRQLKSTGIFMPSFQIDLSDVSPGIYFYIINSKDGFVKKKGKLVIISP